MFLLFLRPQKPIYNILCIKELLLATCDCTHKLKEQLELLLSPAITEDPYRHDWQMMRAEYCCPTPSFNTQGKGNETGMTLCLHSFVQCTQGKAQHMWSCIQPLSQTSICEWRLSGGGNAGAADFSQHDIRHESTEDPDACLGSCVTMFFPLFLGYMTVFLL